jgi:hypothetical protein
MMRGTYRRQRMGYNYFDIEIAPFALKGKYTVN